LLTRPYKGIAKIFQNKLTIAQQTLKMQSLTKRFTINKRVAFWPPLEVY